MNTLLAKLQTLVKKEVLSAHMPGHKYRALHDLDWYVLDTTEIDGADNLFAADGILLESMRDIATIYGAQQSRLLVNGSTVGVLASILAVTKPNEQIIIARDAHKSVYNACRLGNLRFSTVLPNTTASGVSLGYSSAAVIAQLNQQPNVKTVVLMSPSYHGYTTDFGEIAACLKARGGLLIVDEAHGAHLNFGNFAAKSALQTGADIVVQSAHKTLPSLTQTAMLHYAKSASEQVIEKIDQHLQMLQTSSPSYVLMSALDLAVKTMTKQRASQCQLENHLADLYQKLGSWTIYPAPDDPFKLWLESAPNGYSGYEINTLLKRSGIYCELYNDWGALLYLSPFNTVEELQIIYQIIVNIPKKQAYQSTMQHHYGVTQTTNSNQATMHIATEQSFGQTIAEDVIPYPPGIPLILKGEIITEQHIAQIVNLREQGAKVVGVHDQQLNTLTIYKG